MQITGDDALLAHALDTERSYFRLGADAQEIDGALVAIMPGLERLPAASVCIFSERNMEQDEAARAVAHIESAFRRAGVATARIYTGKTSDGFDSGMRAAGYRRRTEKIHAFCPLPSSAAAGTAWRPVAGDGDWVAKAAIHALPSAASDGYDASPEQWIALERLKSQTDALGFWLYLEGGEPVATTGLMRCTEGVLRIKNFYVRADRRGRGVGKAALSSLLRQLKEAGENAVVVLSIEGSVGERLYRSAGARAIGRIFEWSRPLASPF